jgi:hypothetical protein
LQAVRRQGQPQDLTQKDAKGAKEGDNRSRVMSQISLARGTPQVDAVGFGREIVAFFAVLASFA